MRLIAKPGPGECAPYVLEQYVALVPDDGRIYAYRALRFARGDRTALPGFGQDDYAREAGVDVRDAEVATLVDAITADDARGYFRHCGYATPR